MPNNPVSTKTPKQRRVLARAKGRNKKDKPIHAPLPGSIILLKDSLAILWEQRRFFVKLVLLYVILSYVFVKSVGGTTDPQSIKNSIAGQQDNVTRSIRAFGSYLVRSGESNNDNGPVYQTILMLFTSLATIYALRKGYKARTKKPQAKLSLRTAFYEGVAPIVPFCVVLVILGLQLIPFSFGAGAYSSVTASGLAVGVGEKAFWLALVVLFAGISLYLIVATLMALFFVTIPGTTPMKAYRAAKELVRGRRFIVMSRVLFLVCVLLLVLGLFVVPLIAYITPLAAPVFFLLSALCLPIVLSYLYSLYRRMI